MKRTDTTTLIESMRILAREIQSEDGVANSAISEAADRLEEFNTALQNIVKHQEIMGGRLASGSGAWKIATQTLRDEKA